MATMIECAFITSVITSDRDRDPSAQPADTTLRQTRAQHDTMEKRIPGLGMLWHRPSAAPDKSGCGTSIASSESA